MTHPPIRTAIAGVLLLSAGLLSGGLPAQTTYSQKDCEQAARVISSGRVNANQRSAYLKIMGCGLTGATAFAAGIPKTASDADTARLGEYMLGADNWRDAAIFSAATQLANNAAATPQARVYAISHLIKLVEPYMMYNYYGLTYSSDTTVTADGMQVWGGGCRGRIVSARAGAFAGAPLPATYESQIRATLAALANSQTAPAPVRNAARCLLPP